MEMVIVDIGEGLLVVTVVVVIGGDFVVVEVVDEGYLMNDLTCSGTHHRLGLDHRT